MQFQAKVKRVVDGDTLDLDIDLGFHITLSERVRLMGIDTPETRSRDPIEKSSGLIAKDVVIDFVNDGAVVRLWYINSIQVTISVISETITVLPLTASPNGFDDITSVV